MIQLANNQRQTYICLLCGQDKAYKLLQSGSYKSVIFYPMCDDCFANKSREEENEALDKLVAGFLEAEAK